MIWSEAINDAGYAAAVRQVLDKTGRAHLSDFLTDAASRALFEAMQTIDWRLITNAGGATRDIPLSQVAQTPGLGDQLIREAGSEFRFVYDGYRLAKLVQAHELTSGALFDFFQFLNSAPAIRFWRAMSGDRSIVHLDAMATRYRRGHFLTEHHDYEPGSDRRLAYVFNLTPTWRTDWGGWLTFYGADGHVAEAYAPRWGALNVFKVPTAHAVSCVTPFATAARFSITGWMRAKADL